MLRRFRVSAKLLLATILTLIIMVTVGIIGIISVGKIETQLENTYKRNVVGLEKVTDAERAIRRISTADAEYLSKGASGRVITKQEVRQQARLFNEAMEAYLPTINSDQTKEKELEIVNRLKAAFEKLVKTNESLSSTETDIAKQIYEQQIIPQITETTDIVSELVEWKVKSADLQREVAAQEYETSRTIMLSSLLAGIIISLLLNMFIARGISRPLAMVTAAAGKLAAGELNVDIRRGKGQDEVAMLSRAFIQMVENLRALVGQIAGSAESVASAAEEMS
ncbi:MAG: MCP four helix bundle domain-containing protein, partial [Bacillota bacterium]